jgi:hypothetical protein
MGSFLSGTFIKSFSSKYVYVEATTTPTAPSPVLSPELGKVNFVTFYESTVLPVQKN